MRRLILIVHNVRSTHNVGSLLRTGEGLGVQQVFLTGYTPYPTHPDDERLPHTAQKIDRQIAKTALGAEKQVSWQHSDNVAEVVTGLKRQGFIIAGLEQAPGSIKLAAFQPPDKLALIVGREVEGLEAEVLALCDHILEIPMLGRKESYNVAVAAGMALYALRFHPS
ncbi:MAG TPA: TrmH family RNA methyltransferase [Candidatus Saccharimonadales bacterium]